MSAQGSRKHSNINRRDFIKIGASGAVIAGAGCISKKEPLIPRKRMGKTDIKASIVGMGGGSALSMIQDHEEAVALIEYAYKAGINFFDSSPLYGGRSSLQRFGRALKPFRRDIYLSSKYEAKLSYDEVMSSFERTLDDYQTDYIDLVQIHSIESMEEVETMFTSGALDALVKLKEEGVARYLGITSHNHPPALTSAIERFDFDVVQMALNASKVPFLFEFEERGTGSFEEMTLPVALSKNMGVRAFKATGQRRLIGGEGESGKAGALELIRYSLSLPVDGIILGMHKYEHIDSVKQLVADFKPMTSSEMKAMNDQLAASANKLTLDYLRPEYVDDGMPRAHLA